jgi:hypothetical protein
MSTQQATAQQVLQAVDLTPTNVPVVQQPALPSTVVTPADLLRIAMESGDKDIERLERLMAMDERYRESQERERKRQAELAAREDFRRFKELNIVVPKTKQVTQRAKGGGAGPTYVQSEFEVVAAMLQPALAACGFGYRFDVKFERGADGPWCTVTCLLEHRLGHVETLTLGGPPDDSGAKNPLQEMQSSATFLMRHALLAITGTAQAGKDNDGRGARGYREDAERSGQAPEGDDDPEASRLVDEGNAAAEKGEKALNTWWSGLTQQQRNKANPYFGGMKTVARRKGA